jgi:hypothetical protein
VNAQLLRTTQEDIVEVRAARLKTAPGAFGSAAVRLETARAIAFHPDAVVAKKVRVDHFVACSEAMEKRLDSGVQRLAGTVAGQAGTVDQRDGESALRALNRGGATGGPGADDQDVALHCGQPPSC